MFSILTWHSLTLVAICLGQMSKRHMSAEMLQQGFHMNEPTGQKE